MLDCGAGGGRPVGRLAEPSCFRIPIVLTPLMVAACGRSGTTALMSLLTADPRVCCDRVYPYEHRYLTYFAKLAVLLERQDPTVRVTGKQLYDFGDAGFGSYPWDRAVAGLLGDPASAAGAMAKRWLRSLWDVFGQHVAEAAPGAAFYAEKVPAWLPPVVRECFDSLTLYLFRDPRDIYLSANAFMRKRGRPGFDRLPADTDRDYARTLAHGFLNYFENYFMDRYRDDHMVVRYEELVQQPDHLAARLEQRLQLHLRWDAPGSWLEMHRTSSDLARSVDRWQREPLPEGVAGFLETYLRAEMAHLGYAPGAARRQDPLPSLEFRSGALDLGRAPCSADGQVDLQPDAAEARVTGGDFWMILPLPSFDAGAVREIWVSLKGAVGDSCSVYWRGDAGDFSEERCLRLPYRGAQHWQVLRFRVAQHPLWTGSIAGLRLDPFNETGPPMRPVSARSGFIRWLRLVE